MSEEERNATPCAGGETDERSQPFSFRFATQGLKDATERMATAHYRTVGQELNALCAAATAAFDAERSADAARQ